MELNTIDDEWSNFITNKYIDNSSEDEQTDDVLNNKLDTSQYETFTGPAPEPTDIYISTKSKIAYLENP